MGNGDMVLLGARDREKGDAAAEGWPDWINIPSKVGQVAAARIGARLIEESRPGAGIRINAVCPGLVDTEASRPWFSDMSAAQSPEQAAKAIIWPARSAPDAALPNGELVQFRKLLS